MIAAGLDVPQQLPRPFRGDDSSGGSGGSGKDGSEDGGRLRILDAGCGAIARRPIIRSRFGWGLQGFS